MLIVRGPDGSVRGRMAVWNKTMAELAIEDERVFFVTERKKLNRVAAQGERIGLPESSWSC
jgi:hypothetical protein